MYNMASSAAIDMYVNPCFASEHVHAASDGGHYLSEEVLRTENRQASRRAAELDSSGVVSVLLSGFFARLRILHVSFTNIFYLFCLFCLVFVFFALVLYNLLQYMSVGIEKKQGVDSEKRNSSV